MALLCESLCDQVALCFFLSGSLTFSILLFLICVLSSFSIEVSSQVHIKFLRSMHHVERDGHQWETQERYVCVKGAGDRLSLCVPGPAC